MTLPDCPTHGKPATFGSPAPVDGDPDRYRFICVDGHSFCAERPTEHDPVNHPKHYNQHPSGVECIQVVEHMNFNLGNAVKYIWRAGEKNDIIEDLNKAAWYVQREIQRLSTTEASGV